jgi:hypothetical protein
LAKRKTPWLLVFDNFDEPKKFQQKTIKDYFPRSGQGFILLTSRHAALETLGHCIGLYGMTESEGLELLFRRSNCERNERTEVEGKKILERLGYLPLAIDQASAYIKSCNLDLGIYLSLYSDRREKLLQKIPDSWDYRKKLDESNFETSLSSFTTWELSLDQISGGIKEREAKMRFLTLAAFFDGREVCLDLFYRGPDGARQAWVEPFLRTDFAEEDDVQDVLAELRNLSLIQGLQTKLSGTFFSLHPLIQDWVKYRIDADSRRQFTIEARDIVNRYIYSRYSDLDFHKRQRITLI